MAEIVKFIEVNHKYNRAVALVKDDRTLFFGVAVKRFNPESNAPYYCLYCSLTLEEYEFLLMDEESENLSFLGIASVSITVSKVQADTLLMDQPQHYAGIHCSEELTAQMDKEDMIIRLEGFCSNVRARIAAMRAKHVH